MRPALLLRFGGRAELADEPLLNQRVGPTQGIGNGGDHHDIVDDIRKTFAWKFLLDQLAAGLKNLLSLTEETCLYCLKELSMVLAARTPRILASGNVMKHLRTIRDGNTRLAGLLWQPTCPSTK